MIWPKLNFGKHRGKTLPQVLFSDADWFFWAIEEEVFSDKPQLLKEVMDLDKKARNILIPSKYGDDAIVQYLIHTPTGKFGDMHIVKKDQTPHEGSSEVFYSKRIDMSYPRLIAKYDKFGCRQIVKSIKYHYFGDRKIRMTKNKCEEFFENDQNFV